MLLNIWIVPKHPASLLFDMILLLQQRMLVVKMKDKRGLALAIDRIKALHAWLRAVQQQ
jgi:hypothetical protein